MKLNVRYTSPNPRNVSRTQESGSPLVKAFKNLQENVLYSHRDIASLDTLVYLKPFLSVIRSEETTGPITGVALASVNKFLCTFMNENSPNVAKSIESIAEAVTHCRFEATDPDSDEVVLMKILQVLESCIKSPVVIFLSEDLVMEMIQTCFRMSSQIRLSELLRKTAEKTLLEMVQSLFAKLKSNPSVFDKNGTFGNASPRNPENVYTPPPSPSTTPDMLEVVEKKLSRTELDKNNKSANEAPATVDLTLASPHKEFINAQGSNVETVDTSVKSGKPFGVSCLRRLITFICGIVKLPHSESEDHIEFTVCLMGLNLLHTILEISGSSLQNTPSIMKMVREDVCIRVSKCLASDDLLILSASLRIFYNLFIYYGQHLKLQIELFFNTLIKIMDSKSVGFVIQETILECVVNFCKEPTFMTNLYVNFDCDLSCSNVFENLCKFLYKNAYPVSGVLYTTNMLSLEGLIYILQSIASRLPTGSARVAENLEMSADAMRIKKQMKTKILQGVETFNREPDDGLKYLQSVHLLSDPIDPKAVANFMRNSYGVNKTSIGEYVGKNKPQNISTLHAYVQTFDLKSHNSFIDCLREFLENFRIPGEAQVISRILESYTKYYFEVVKQPFETADAAYILSYSIVMLNVDQHNKEVKQRMSEKDFIRNNRGINNGKDFPPEMLSEIFHSIKNSEMKIPEEHIGVEVTDSMWRQLLNKSKSSGSFIVSNEAIYDQDIFAVIWGSLIAAISVVFDTAYDENVLQKMIDGFNLCAQISAHYHMSDVLDNLVISLCKFSMLLSLSGSTAIASFGQNKKAQLATQTVFDVTRMHGDYLREGWKNILNCILTLHKIGALPSIFDAIPSFETTENAQPRTPTQQPKSLLTSFWSGAWFGGTSEPQEEPTEHDMGAEKIAKDCIKECNLQEIVHESKYLQEESLIYLVKALIVSSSKPPKPSPHFDSKTAIFCLDFLTRVTQLNENRITLIWNSIGEHFTSLLDQPITSPPLFDKAIINAITLCMHLLQRKIVSDQCLNILKLLLRIDAKVAETSAKQIVLGISKLVETNRPVLQSQSGAEVILAFVEFSSRFPNSITYGFNMLRSLTLDNHSVVPQNFALWQITVFNFTKSKYAPNICIQAVELLHALFGRASSFLPHGDSSKHNSSIVFDVNESHRVTVEEEVWTNYWLPVLHAFCKLCLDPRVDVRNQAMTFLQRSLLSPSFTLLSAQFLINCYDQILFPLLTDLLKTPQELQIDAFGLEETRLRVSALLSKIFLQYLSKLVHMPSFTHLWIKILNCFKTYSQGSELLSEAVRESMKNILLVMSSLGVFKPDNDPESLWQVSWNTINSFCPTLKTEFDEVLSKADAPNQQALSNQPQLIQPTSSPGPQPAIPNLNLS